MCVQTCIPVLISLLQGTSVSLEHSVVATIESALGSGIHRMWGNEAGYNIRLDDSLGCHFRRLRVANICFSLVLEKLVESKPHRE